MSTARIGHTVNNGAAAEQAKLETSHLSRDDLRRVVLHTPRDIQSIAKEHSLFIAGGFIRSVICNEPPNDIDLFGSTADKLREVAGKLANSRGGRLHGTGNAYTVLSEGRTPVQFIHRWLYEQPESLLKEFDYTIACAVVWWNTQKEQWSSLCDSNYYADLAAKRLVYRRPNRKEDAGGSLLRARKFLSRGYHISAHNLGLVVARLCSGIDFKAVEANGNLEQVIIGKLREVDPLLIIDRVDTVDEHESIPAESALRQ